MDRSSMAKKKRKKRPPQRPAQRAGTATATASRTEAPERTASARAERKEQARRERERRIKQARRQVRMRRAVRWGIAAVVVLGIGGAVWLANRESRELQGEAAAAARRLGGSEVQTKQDQLDAAPIEDQQALHSPPFAQGSGGEPVTAGRHSNPLPSPPFVYDQPIPEASAVHNLEHGYVIVYYSADGEQALAEDIRTELEGYVEEESNKILMAPYPGLAHSFDLVAWGNLQTFDPPEGANPEDALTVTRAFVDQFRSGGMAPEPSGV
ncbi:MAG TPA: DUF3105 domain-containing protein [Actinomycetota bacterium]|nr:DUF3105 domain-containing protein [Actinomycetota bacterium]